MTFHYVNHSPSTWARASDFKLSCTVHKEEADTDNAVCAKTFFWSFLPFPFSDNAVCATFC